MAIHTCLVTYIYLVTYICPTKFSDVGFCPTKFKLCPTKIKSDRTNVLSNIYLQPCSGPRSLVALTVALISGPHSGRAANYCRTSDNVRLNLANVRAKVILIGHWSDHKKKLSHTFFCCDKIRLQICILQ